MPPADWWVSTGEVTEGRTMTPFSLHGPRQYHRRFKVVVNYKEVDGVLVCFAPDLPKPLSFYTSPDGSVVDFNSLAVNVGASQPDPEDWQVWMVDIEYSTNIRTGVPGAGGGWGHAPEAGSHNNPELEKPDINWDMEVSQFAPPYDLDEVRFITSAKQPLTPTPTIPVGNLVLTYTRNELQFNQSQAEKYTYAVNSDTFLGRSPGHVQCVSITGRSAYLQLTGQANPNFQGYVSYFRVTYKFRFLNELQVFTLDSWQPKFLNAGLMELTADNKLKAIMRDGHPVSQPVCLDNDGKAIEPADLISGAKKPIHLKFRVYKDLPFAPLMIRGA